MKTSYLREYRIITGLLETYEKDLQRRKRGQPRQTRLTEVKS